MEYDETHHNVEVYFYTRPRKLKSKKKRIKKKWDKKYKKKIGKVQSISVKGMRDMVTLGTPISLYELLGNVSPAKLHGEIITDIHGNEKI